MSVMSSSLFERLSDIQLEAAQRLMKDMMKTKQTKKVEISTQKESYLVSITEEFPKHLIIDDGMDTMNEFKIDPSELIGLVESFEYDNRID